MKIDISTHLDRATVERAKELTAAQNRYGADMFDRDAWTLETYLAAMLPIWIRRDWDAQHGLDRRDPAVAAWLEECAL